MRDRLIELLGQVQECGFASPADMERYQPLYPRNEEIADHLLANGVIVPRSPAVVEVVRCKDCVHYRKMTKVVFCIRNGDEVSKDDYCSYGERETCGDD